MRGDPQMLQRVWINLLDNAIKFSGREAQRGDRGRRSSEGGETVFFVKDNGVGFDMRYVGKLFGVFQRLHRVEEFPGTGIGLAIVHRIVTGTAAGSGRRARSARVRRSGSPCRTRLRIMPDTIPYRWAERRRSCRG